MEPTIATAPQTVDYDFERPAVPTKTSRYVFFAGNVIPPSVRALTQAWTRGGVIRAEYGSLRHNGGYIPQCEITPCRPYMVAEDVNLVHAERRGDKQETAILNVKGQRTEVGYYVDADTGERKWDGLLRTLRYPDREIMTLIGKQDGIVEMPVQNDEEMMAAQFFLFPNWDRISTNSLILPPTLNSLEAYFQERRQAATTQFEMDVAEAALRSCRDFRVFGNAVIARANEAFEMHKTKGLSYRYGQTAEIMFAFLEVPRLDIVNQQQAQMMDKLTKALTTLAETQSVMASNQIAGSSPAPAAAAPNVDAPAIKPEALEIASMLSSLKPEDLAAIRSVIDVNRSTATELPVEGENEQESPIPPKTAGIKTPLPLAGDVVRVGERTGKIAKMLAGIAAGKGKVLFDGDENPETVDFTKVEFEVVN